MPFAIVVDVPASWDTYQRVQTDLGADAPEGLIVHTAGPTDEGFRIVDLWESEEAFGRFQQERLGPTVAKHTDPGTPRPAFRIVEVKHVLEGLGSLGGAS
jgi:hypothetical protein